MVYNSFSCSLRISSDNILPTYSIEGLLVGLTGSLEFTLDQVTCEVDLGLSPWNPMGKRLPFQRESRMKIENSCLAPRVMQLKSRGRSCEVQLHFLWRSCAAQGRFAESTCRIPSVQCQYCMCSTVQYVSKIVECNGIILGAIGPGQVEAPLMWAYFLVQYIR